MALPAGATSAIVDLQLLDPLAAVASGATVTTTTDRTGRFEVALPRGARATALRAANGGVLNYEATATSVVGGKIWVADYAFSSANAAAPNRSLFTASGALPNGTTTLALTPKLYRQVAMPAATSTPANGCRPSWSGFTNDTAPYTAWETFDEIHAYYDVQVTTEYATQADSDFGVDVSADGSHWGASGSAHIGNSSGAGQGTGLLGPHYGHQMQAEFTGVKRHRYYNDCLGHHTIQYQIYLYQWQGGLRAGADVSAWDGCSGNGQGFCYQPQTDTGVIIRGGHFYRASGRTINYGGSISLFGVGLGGSSTFTKDIRLDMYAGNGTAEHDIFGHGAPPSTAGAVYSY